MNLLIVSYVYAPDRSPRAYRWTAIAEYWAKQGHQVHVISGWKSGDVRTETLNGVIVWRVGNAIGERLRGLLGRRSHGSTTPSQGTGAQSRLVRLAKWLYDRTWKLLYWPDYAGFWFFPARKQALRLCETQSFDALISVSHPFTGHMVGLALKSSRPQLPWLADVGDPFSLLVEIPLNNYRLYSRLNRWAEARVLTRAESITVTVDACRTAYERTFPGSAAKTTIIPPLFSLPPLPKGESSELLRDDGRHLVFLGTLYKALRNPLPLLRLFDTLNRNRNDLHLHFLGTVNDCEPCFEPYRHSLGPHLHLHGMVSREHAALCMNKADLLINIGNATSHQLPSKLVEYVSTGRPILNLVSSPDDTSVPFLAEYPAALTLMTGEPDHNDLDRIANLIDSPPPVSPEFVAHFLSRFTVETLANQYFEQIESLRPSTGEGPSCSVPSPKLGGIEHHMSNAQEKKSTLLSILVVGWLCAVIGAYYTYQADYYAEKLHTFGAALRKVLP